MALYIEKGLKDIFIANNRLQGMRVCREIYARLGFAITLVVIRLSLTVF